MMGADWGNVHPLFSLLRIKIVQFSVFDRFGHLPDRVQRISFVVRLVLRRDCQPQHIHFRGGSEINKE